MSRSFSASVAVAEHYFVLQQQRGLLPAPGCLHSLLALADHDVISKDGSSRVRVTTVVCDLCL